MIAVCPPALLKLIMARDPKAPPAAAAKSPPVAAAKSPRAPGARKLFNVEGRPADQMLPSHEERLDRTRAYIKKMPPSIQGLDGSQKLFLAATAAVRGLCLDQDNAMMVLREDFNPRCVPPWSEAELLHKVVDASHALKVPWTYLMPGIGFDQDGAEVVPTIQGGGQPPRVPRPPLAAAGAYAARLGGPEPEAQPGGAGGAWLTSSLKEDYEYVSVVITKVEFISEECTKYRVCFSREDDADQPRCGSLEIDHPLTERAIVRWACLRHALGLPEDADIKLLRGKRLRIQYFPKRGPNGRAGLVYPPIADNQARWQSPALAVVRKRLPPTHPLRLKIERVLANRYVPWLDRSIQAWWELNWHTAVEP